MSDRTTLEELLAEARRRLDELTRELQESPSAEMDPELQDELERVRLRILELERMLEEMS